MPGRALAAPPIVLGNAASYGVMAGAAVINSNNTAIDGNLGVSPSGSVTGFPPGTVSGTVHAGDAAAAAAKSDALAAYNDAAGRTPTASVAAQLGGTTKGPGVYTPSSGTAFQISGTLTLDAQTDPNAIFVFQASTLTTATVSNINLVRGAQADNVFFQLSGSATLGVNSTFQGNVLASNTATVSTGAAVKGRVLVFTNNLNLQGTTTGPFTRVSVPDDPPTDTALTVTPSPSREGQQITMSATVTPESGDVIPQGEVAFKDGTTLLGTDFVDPSGHAQLQVSNLDGGDHEIRAVYLGGDTFSGEQVIHFAPSTSPGVVQVVTNTLWAPSATPAVANHTGTDAVTLGVKFRSSVTGAVRGIRFYKGSQNTGTHVGALWTQGGQQLATVTFSGESGSGWQQANFSSPVSINANTTYIASYFTPSGHFSYTLSYFTSQYNNPPLSAPSSGASGGNGVYTYGASSAFPTSTFQSTNYWVEPVFVQSDTVFSDAATPDVANHSDTDPVTVGVKFRSVAAGSVRGIRFFKGSQNTGTHVGTLWTAGGQEVASVNFTGETASGWQQAVFVEPIPITANTTYIASYHTDAGHFSYTVQGFFDRQSHYPLTALENGTSGTNGVFTYGATNTFPTGTYQGTNYWVDVLFDIG
ncbi:DUF4082 domain-containing protein [Nonomuraea sp. 3-1Str]|uniref:DUF4082 domain-containing protein n=1 Tax=Nonomuraea sp. 3-1Str TaxID=2929801 RepID=UPI00285CECC3|nr:DUF4082 domain-containing protein [Nonomuraea sp. 3-1Str]MDR8414579.1 DUF4082 domain-containing protein [Nonomuraea sp. 3-1Str]